MPIYEYRDEDNNRVSINAPWNRVKGMCEATPEEICKMLLEVQAEGNVMDGTVVPEKKYRRVLCAPSLVFKGSGFHCTDYGKTGRVNE